MSEGFFSLSHEHMDKLSRMYSGKDYTVVIYGAVNDKFLSAIVYYNTASPEMDIFTYLSRIHEDFGLESFERVTRVYMHSGNPIRTADGDVDYRQIRIRAIHDF